MKLVLLFSFFLLISCGNPGKSNHQKKATNLLRDDLQTEDVNELSDEKKSEHYLAVLGPVNENMFGFVSGSVSVTIEGDSMATNIRFNGPFASTVHTQIIHSGGFCPISDVADANADGYVDFQETQAYSSGFLIPLDNDLNSQEAGNEFFPMSDNWGTYIYSRLSSFRSLLNDLYLPDPSTDDNTVKLIPGSPLFLDERVVVIYGVEDSVTLPSTVGAIYPFTPNQITPIACGTFSKVEAFPGTLEPDDITIGTLGIPSERRPDNGRNTSVTSNPRNRPPRPGTTSPNVGGSSPMCRRDKTCE